MLEFIIAIILGIGVGIFTGLSPGIHINLISVILLSFYSSFSEINPFFLVIFIVSMAIAHTFMDFIPSVFLGAPDENSFLSILPGHQLLLQGKGYAAIVYTLYGSIMGLFVVIFYTPIFIYVLPKIYPLLQNIMAPILILISLILIFSEEKEKRLLAFFIFILAGFLGIATLNLNVKEPLLPLFTGLFGASSLIISLHQKTKIPEQKIIPLHKIRLSLRMIRRTMSAAVIASPFTAFLPGLGTSQAALIGKQLMKIDDQRQFLFLLGAINVIVMGLSFITLYSIGKMRTGAAVAVSQLLPEFSRTHLYLILLTIVLAGMISFVIAILFSKLAAKYIYKVPYEILSKVTLLFLFVLVLFFSDFSIRGSIIGLIILVTATALGIFTISSEVKRIHLMGCLLIPTIFFYI
ncbi:tripartite tricarboxylate transporter permease [Candidatus Pacearchaeota archaeon]|nr:tripartite tricarboxylate transporter permease [Candidatus Pacearchaeota archaeon]